MIDLPQNLPMDALSELLRAVKLSGALFYNSSCTAPWCLQAPQSSAFLPFIRAQATRVIEFHHITEGAAYVRVGGETTPLAAGDIVMMPHGDPHELGAGVGGKPLCGDDAMSALWTGRIQLANFGGGGERTGLVCGYLACDGELLKPVLAGLPRVVRVNIRTDPSGEWLDNLLRHAVAQAAAATPGGDVILAHLAEVRFIGQAPMAYLTEWRLELGAEALRSTSRSVQRVALDSGYESEAAFNRAFKRRFAVPPARYRREARAAVAAKIPPAPSARRVDARA